MLVLSRKLNQSIVIGENVRVVVVSVDRDTVRLGIEAPREVPVHRAEVFEEIRRANQAALGREVAAPAQPAAVAPAKLKSRRVTPK
jgi:carbon storage regulator